MGSLQVCIQEQSSTQGGHGSRIGNDGGECARRIPVDLGLDAAIGHLLALCFLLENFPIDRWPFHKEGSASLVIKPISC